MTDLTPPPEQPMDDDTRARIRARLAEETSSTGHASTGHSSTRRWLLPIAAAVAVLVIAMGGAYAAFWPGDDEPADPAPAMQESTEPSAAPTTPAQSTEPETLPSSSPSTQQDPAAKLCARAVAEQLTGAEQVVSWELPKGESGIWVAGDRSVLCEDSGGIATAHGARPVSASPMVDREALGFSSSTYYMDRRQALTAYVAGGPLPEGVTGIDYAFPDGHTERAHVKSDESGRSWWSMAYVPYDSPLADPQRNILSFDPVQVTVSLSGAQHRYTLEWGRDDCAQVNHGC